MQPSELIDRLDPALLTAQQLDAATVDQETGVRGYVLLPRPELLEPYALGRADEAELTLSVDGTERRIPMRDVGSARTVADWDAELKGTSV